MSLFSKLFKRNKVVINSLDLVNINNFIVYPDKSFYEEKENIELYKEFNNYYKEILNTHKSVTSKDFTIEEVDINLYTDIIKKLLFELDYTLDLVNNSEERNNINIKILYLKLKHYQNEINNYKNKLFIKLKVLNELYKRHIFSKNKREAIKSEITNIEFKIVICQSNFHALNLEINNYNGIINYTNLKEVDENEYLSKRSKRLERYMGVFDLNYKENKSLSCVVANELVLESYLFLNKKNIMEDINSIKNNKLDLNTINMLIFMYSSLIEYTNDKTLQDDLNKLFKEKYDLLFKKGITNYNDFMTDLDEVYFETFIIKDIMDILNGKFTKRLSHDANLDKKEKVKLQNLIKNVFYEDGKLNPEEVLNNNIKMGILNVYKNGNGYGDLDLYIKHLKVDKELCNKSLLCEDIFSWEKEISFRDYVKLIKMYISFKDTLKEMEVELLEEDNEKRLEKTLLGKIFMLTAYYFTFNTYKSEALFDSLISINDKNASNYSQYVLNSLLKQGIKREIKFPECFTSFEIGNVTKKNLPYNNILLADNYVLHDGVKNIILGKGYKYRFGKFVIKPSLEKFEFCNPIGHFMIVFEDFEDSKLFKNDTNFYNFLTSVINSEVDITIWFLSKNKDFRFDINTKPYRYMILENEEKVKMLYEKIYEEFRIRNYNIDYLINSRELIKTKKVLK